jgi:rare lipoprotein A
MMRMLMIYAFLILFLAGCASIEQVKKVPPSDVIEGQQKCVFLDKGMASWYGDELFGNKTANGEKFVPEGITAAHKTLPFGTIVKVTLDNGKGNPEGVTVRINDRGPFVKGRIIDLSWGAAKKLGMMDTQKVHIYRCS